MGGKSSWIAAVPAPRGRPTVFGFCLPFATAASEAALAKACAGLVVDVQRNFANPHMYSMGLYIYIILQYPSIDRVDIAY